MVTNVNGNQAIYGNQLLSTQEFDVSSFTIYPNPVTAILQINTQNTIVIKNIQVYDVMGKKLMETKNSNQIDVSILASGLLFVKIETDKGFVVKKVVKE
ncbi:MAG: T9SS type A sorting domain-containing protein [Flavobacteriaceae bacterium]|nr:T9SS type A sorting domain-containing protein [Flavobacteriaceae bacterium]